MSNSALISCTRLSPFFSKRTHEIDTITIHCVAGNGTADAIGRIFQQTGRNASSNYGVGTDGSIGLYVEESCRSWCSSNSANDNRAVTIEVANCGGAPDWPVSEAAWKSMIALCTDICWRNGIKRLLWKADKSLVGKIEQQNMTAHRWFANKSCPGNYLYDRMGAIAAEVNRNLEALEDAEMTGEEINRRQMEYLRSLPTSEYAEEACRMGIESGLFLDGDNDGLVDNPRAPVTRQDLALVLMRAGLLHKPTDSQM